jgi:hypothetical protein
MMRRAVAAVLARFLGRPNEDHSVLVEDAGIIERQDQIIVDPLPTVLPGNQVVVAFILAQAVAYNAITLETAVGRPQLRCNLLACDRRALEEIELNGSRRWRRSAAGECGHAGRK